MKRNMSLCRILRINSWCCGEDLSQTLDKVYILVVNTLYYLAIRKLTNNYKQDVSFTQLSVALLMYNHKT